MELVGTELSRFIIVGRANQCLINIINHTLVQGVNKKSMTLVALFFIISAPTNYLSNPR